MKYEVIISIVLLIGILFLLHFLYLFMLSKQTKKWLSVKGVIDASNLETTNQDIGNDMSVSYKANVKYQYEVEGKVYFSERIFIGDYIRRNLSRNVKKLTNKYSKGEVVLVYYNPKYPNKAILEIGVHPLIYRELLVGILFFILFTIMLSEKSLFVSLLY